jgi:hypothetical protein
MADNNKTDINVASIPEGCVLVRLNDAPDESSFQIIGDPLDVKALYVAEELVRAMHEPVQRLDRGNA